MVTPASSSPNPEHSQHSSSEDVSNKISQVAQSIIQQVEQPQIFTSDHKGIHVPQETILYEKMIASPELLDEWVQNGDDTSIKNPEYRQELFKRYVLHKQPGSPIQIDQLPKEKLKELLKTYAVHAPVQLSKNQLLSNCLANDIDLLREVTVAMVMARHPTFKEGLAGLEPHFIKNREIAMSIAKECAQKAPIVDIMSFFLVQTEQDRLMLLMENCRVAPDMIANSPLPLSMLSSKGLHQLATHLCQVRLAGRIKTADQKKVLDKVLSQAMRCGNAPQVWKLLNLFSHSFDEIEQIYCELIQNKGTILTHLVLPMIPIACWVKHAASSNSSDPNKLKENLMNLRDLLRDIASSSPMVNLLGVMLLVNGDKSIAPARKITLMEEITRGIPKKDASLLTDRLRAVSILVSSMSTDVLQQSLGESCHILSESILNSLITNDYFDLKEIENLTQKYLNTFGATRIPNLIQLYAEDLQINQHDNYRNDFNILVTSVLENRFYETRNRNNQIHAEKIRSYRPELWESWTSEHPPQTVYLDKDRPFHCYDTADWKETLMCANEVPGSCLTINGFGSNPRNVGLLGYFLDPKNRIFTIKDDTGKIACRMVARLLWDETTQSAALFIEKIYGKMDPLLRKHLMDFAIKRAEDLQIPLFTKSERYGQPTKHVLKSYGTYPAEYVDSISEIVDQEFTVTSPRLITTT